MAAERPIEKLVKGSQNGVPIRAEIGRQQAGSRERINFGFAQLYSQAPQSFSSTITVSTHARCGWRARIRRRGICRHGFTLSPGSDAFRGRCSAQYQRPNRPSRRKTPQPKPPHRPHSTQKCRKTPSRSSTRPRRLSHGSLNFCSALTGDAMASRYIGGTQSAARAARSSTAAAATCREK
jgi:hypothetical protein